ncbi:MAG: hypothetical protein HY597_07335 [Candidatus Omnitrophica bacterium]|nr:hypothetical protein [Candidatus Omnitrophota bacterium]
MKIRVDSSVKTYYQFDFERSINQLLKVVPPDHLRDLDWILVVRTWKDKSVASARGLHYERYGEGGPTIVLCVDAIFGPFARIFERLPLLPKMFLAEVLFHEIGHHHQRYLHGIQKSQREGDAKSYSKEMFRKAFRPYRWQLYLLYGPIVLPWKLIQSVRRLFPKTQP